MGIWDEMRKQSIGESVKQEDLPDPISRVDNDENLWGSYYSDNQYPFVDYLDKLKEQSIKIHETKCKLDELSKALADLRWKGKYNFNKCWK